MRVIPVIDLKEGLVVRGVAGRRDQYRPIQSKFAADPRPATVARAFARQFGFDTVYVADLDAIMRGTPDVQAWQEIANAGLKLWLDAGVGSAEAQERILESLQQFNINFTLIVGLESLKSFDELAAIIKRRDFPILSIDLKDGKPITAIPELQTATALAIARQMWQVMGIREMIVLDLADVGTGSGTSTLDVIRQIRAVFPWQRQLIAGGGVRGLEDLRTLADAGCTDALVASALHDGNLTREAIEAARKFPPARASIPVASS